ncbi:hypothetical protein LENED_003029 [Lentinula edodes]|uniref:Uncharacterized protein n=1 Tax=Lentinula edodes TaxID=5353 RepID=A0A1Q3E2G4_LENED|nr:hypothetical protein LENED_003029 [Lentinula edodes]
MTGNMRMISFLQDPVTVVEQWCASTAYSIGSNDGQLQTAAWFYSNVLVAVILTASHHFFSSLEMTDKHLRSLTQCL